MKLTKCMAPPPLYAPSAIVPQKHEPCFQMPGNQMCSSQAKSKTPLNNFTAAQNSEARFYMASLRGKSLNPRASHPPTHFKVQFTQTRLYYFKAD
jgi:hypothetical protein